MQQCEPNAGSTMLSDDHRSLLAPPNLLARLTAEELELVRSCAVDTEVDVGSRLFHQDEPHSGIFLILNGLVRVYYVSPAGREITLGYWSTGHFAGGPEVFGRGRHVWSGRAVRRTQCLFLPGRDIERLVRRIPNFAVGIIEGLSYKGRCYSTLCRILGTHSVFDRLVLLLRLLGDLSGARHSQGIIVDRHFTHEDLAHLTGATRQWVTVSLRRLEERGLITRSRQCLILRPALYSRSEALCAESN